MKTCHFENYDDTPNNIDWSRTNLTGRDLPSDEIDKLMCRDDAQINLKGDNDD